MSFHVIGLPADKSSGGCHGLEIVLGDPLETAHGRNLRFRHREVFDMDAVVAIPSVHRNGRRHPDRDDARELLESPQNLLLRPHRLLEIRDLCLRNAYLETEDVVGLHEARLHVAERLKASDHETRAHEEDEGESNLRNDERTTRPMSFSTCWKRWGSMSMSAGRRRVELGLGGSELPNHRV